MNDNDRREQGTSPEAQPLTGFSRAVPVLLFALAIFIALCFFTKNTGTLGPLISGVLLGLFSSGAFAVPVLILLHALFYPSDLKRGRRLTRLIFSAVFLLTLSCFIYTVTYFGKEVPFAPGAFYQNGKQLIGGGFLGGILAFTITKIFGSVGAIVIAVLVFALYLTYFFAGESRSVKAFSLKALAALATAASFIEKRVRALCKAHRDAKERRLAAQEKQKRSELLQDDFFAVDNGMQVLEIDQLGICETRSREAIEQNPTLHETVYPKGSAAKEPRRATDAATRDFSREPAVPLSVTVPTDERPPIVVEPQDTNTKTSFEAKAREYGLDESAESVFTEDFDPYDLSLNRDLSVKPSSRASEAESGVREYADSLEDEYRQKQRNDEKDAFERKKQEILAGMRRTAPQPQRTHRRRIIEFNEMGEEIVGGTVLESDGVHASIEKNAAEEERAQTTVFFTPALSHEPTDAEAAPRSPLAEATPPRPPRSGESPHNYGRIASFVAGLRQGDTVTEEAARTVEKTAESFVPRRTDSDAAVRADLTEREPLRPEREERPQGDTSHTAVPSVSDFFASESLAQTDAASDPVEAIEPTDEAESTQEPISFRPYSTEDAFRTVIEKTRSEEADAPPELRMERSMISSFDTHEEEEENNAPALEDAEAEEDFSEEEIPEEEQNPAVAEYRNRFTCLDEEDEAEPIDAPSAPEEDTEDEDAPFFTEEDAEDTPVDGEDPETDDEEDEPPFDGARQTNTRFAEYMNQMKQQKPPQEEKPAYVPPDYSDYTFPSVDFLIHGESSEGDSEEIQENAEKLIDTLASFKVTASIKGVDRGPRITRYEVVPARGVKVSAITNLVDDISLNIAAEGIRMEAPIPGKSAIGFEIPNRKAQTVRLRDLIDTDEFITATSKTTACIGKDVTGNPVFGDIAKMPHILVAGATGMGKSVCINAILISILYKARPDEVKFIMVDPKKVEFNSYNGIPHLLVPVVTESKQAAGALMWAVEEMEKRYELIEALHVKKIDDYNEKVKADPSLGTPMSKIIIVIDELNDLMVQVRDPVENLIMRLAQKARAAGIHLIIGTQRPSVNVLTGVIKANIPSRMTCKVSSNVDSRTILEQGGAEKLLNNGDMLYWPVGRPKPLRVQGAFVSDGELERIMDYLKSQAKGNTYDESVLEEINRAAQKCSKKKDTSDDDTDDEENDGGGYLNDPTFLDIVELALNAGRIATSFIQRKMSIGYGRASKYIDVMEGLGIVGEANGSKPREVLITKDEWHEMLSRRSLDE